jgi:hypothetical protein
MCVRLSLGFVEDYYWYSISYGISKAVGQWLKSLACHQPGTSGTSAYLRMPRSNVDGTDGFRPDSPIFPRCAVSYFDNG